MDSWDEKYRKSKRRMDSWEEKYRKTIEKNEKAEDEQNQGCLAILVFIVILTIFGIASAYGQTYQLERGIVAGQSVSFSEGSFINIDRGVLQLHIETYKEPRRGIYGITRDETRVYNNRTIRDMRLLDSTKTNLRIHGMIVTDKMDKTTISVNVYDIETQITTQYVIYTSP